MDPMPISSHGKAGTAFYAMLFALAAALAVAVVCAWWARQCGGEVARLRVQLTAERAEVARLDALVQQAESESGHPIYSNQ